jgi:hypothetical protein
MFLFGVVYQFVGSESGQKESVKLLQNMFYNTTQHPATPQPHTVCIYYTFTLGRGGGEVREKVVRYSNSLEEGSKIPT